MEFTQEFIEEVGLQENQISAIKGHFEKEVIPTIKKEYDGLANKNAEGILSGAANYAKQQFGVDIEREQGEKFGDYLNRISSVGLQAKSTELEEKLKNFKGSDDLKAKYEVELAKNDDLLKKVAELEPLRGYDEKYKQANEQLSGLKLNLAFNNVKPNFSADVNQYEAKAKWDAFKESVLEKYTIELDGDVAIAIDKENEYKKVKLEDLLSANTEITELLKGRQQKGTGANATDMLDVEGVPFKVPKGATSEEQSALVKEYLEKKLGSTFHKDFPKEMVNLLIKIKKQ